MAGTSGKGVIGAASPEAFGRGPIGPGGASRARRRFRGVPRGRPSRSFWSTVVEVVGLDDKDPTVVAVGELAVLSGLIALALALVNGRFWMPALVAGPLVLVQLGFEARSRGRRLIPELAGAVGVCSVAAMSALADGESGRLRQESGW